MDVSCSDKTLRNTRNIYYCADTLTFRACTVHERRIILIGSARIHDAECPMKL